MDMDMDAEEKLKLPNSDKQLTIKYRGFHKKSNPNYNPVVEYKPGVPNPYYKSRPLRPM